MFAVFRSAGNPKVLMPQRRQRFLQLGIGCPVERFIRKLTLGIMRRNDGELCGPTGSG